VFLPGLDGKQKSYCTPEAYRGETCWLFRNRGDGTFEDATAGSGVFDASSKSLGVALLDFDSRWLAGFIGGERYAAEQTLQEFAEWKIQGCCRGKQGLHSVRMEKRAREWA